MPKRKEITEPTVKQRILKKREEDGKKIAIFNSANHLELGIYKSNPKTYGSAASLFGLDYRDPITVKFE